MRKLLILFCWFFSLTSFAQDTLDTRISEELCLCLTGKTNISVDVFKECFLTAGLKYEKQIETRGRALEKKRPDLTAEKQGEQLFERISVNMIYTCDSYYKFMDTLRSSVLRGFDRDSISKVIRLGKPDKMQANTAEYHINRGVLYMIVSDFGNALSSFEEAIRLDDQAYLGVYYKSWTLEFLQKYDEAFLLYNELARKTKNTDFDVFAAIVDRKRNGL
jgi:tetratricopeptide (TPR) repeat protein